MSTQPNCTYNRENYLLRKREEKAKRIYQRMMTGLTIARNKQREMRFMTLTTSEDLRRYSKRKSGELKERTLKESFHILRERIKRATVEKDGFTGFHLNRYFCLRTSEGHGVLHIIFWGGNYIDATWLRKTWLKIHGAYKADIRSITNIKSRVSGLVGYLLDRYLMNQPIERMSYGLGWAWLGFCRSWDHVKQIYWRVGLRKRRWAFMFPGVPSFHYMYTHYTHLRINIGEHFKNGYYQHRDCSQAVPFWRGVLWNPPVTSRQTKFYTEGRGWNWKYFVVP